MPAASKRACPAEIAAATASASTPSADTACGSKPITSTRPGTGCTSEGEYRLDHRHPAVHTSSVRRERPSVGRPVHSHQLAREPQPLGRKEIPLHAAGVLI